MSSSRSSAHSRVMTTRWGLDGSQGNSKHYMRHAKITQLDVLYSCKRDTQPLIEIRELQGRHTQSYSESDVCCGCLMQQSNGLLWAVCAMHWQVRIILNKSDQVDQQQLMRVYGALMWSLGKVFKSPEVCKVGGGGLHR